MGQVWAATQTTTDERLALKLLRTDEEPDRSVRQRFLREARASRAVRHENVVEIQDVFELEDGSPVMAIPPLARAAPHVPAPVARLVDRMLEVERSVRPADLREVAKVLRIYTDQALAQFGPPSKPPGAPAPPAPVAGLDATMAAPTVGDPLARTVAKSSRPRPLVTVGAVVGDYTEIPERSPFPPGKGPWRQKGHLYRSLFKNLEGYVEGGAAAAIERVQDEQVRAFLRQPFAAGGRYDPFPMITLVIQVARKLGIPYFRAVSDLSRMMAETDLNGVYRTLLRVVSPDFLAPRLPRIQGQYLDFGKLRIGETRPRYTEIFRTEHPLVLVHWYVAVVHGFLPLVLGHAAAQDVRVRWDPPVAEGAKLGFDVVTLRFEVQWT